MSRTARRRPVQEAASDEMGGRLVSVPMVTPSTYTDQGHGARTTTLVIRFETSEGRQTRRPYRSLAAAERAVRAAQRRGVSATLALCDLVEIREIMVEPEAAAR